MSRQRHKAVEGQLSLFGDDHHVALTPVAAAIAVAASRNTRICDGQLRDRTSSERLSTNYLAIDCLAALTADRRKLCDADRETLLAFSGFGGLGARVNDYYARQTFERSLSKLKALGTLSQLSEQALDASATAYYTPEAVIDALWAAVRRMGFKGGKVLEPTCGTGHFIGRTPIEIAGLCQFTAVEKEPISAAIAALLYPDATVKLGALEQQKLPDYHYDLVIGNVPFENVTVFDPEFRRNRFLLHDYVIAKAIRKAKPGGLIALISATGTMDKVSRVARKYFAEHAELISAWRLPKEVFSGQGATIATDVLFFKKKARPSELGAEWIATKAITVDSADWDVSAYFVDNPQQVLGSYEVQSRQYGQELTVSSSITASLQSFFPAIERLPQNITVEPPAESPKYVLASSDCIEGEFRYENVADEGKPVFMRLRVVENGLLIEPAPMRSKDEARVIGMIGLRSAVKALLAEQVRAYDDSRCDVLRAALNVEYDRFVAANGTVSDRPNRRVFEEDPSYPLLLAIEVWDEDAEVFQKAPIFARRTTYPARAAKSADSLTDAIDLSVQQFGYVKPYYVASLLRVSESEAIDLLEQSDEAFVDPCSGEILCAADYLSGNVREKLTTITGLVGADTRWRKHFRALTLVQPKLVESRDIYVRLGSPWVPTSTLNEFVQVLGGKQFFVEYDESTASWSVSTTRSCSDVGLAQFETATVSFEVLLSDCLNSRSTTVKRKTATGETIDQQETLAARSKQEDIQKAFLAWLWTDPQRTAALEAIYNERFNCYVSRVYDGSKLQMPGMSDVYVPRPQQVNAIYRSLVTGNLMIPHLVGYGKTLILCGIAMKAKQTGRVSKTMIVVKNNTLVQFTAEFMRIYPGARVLMMSRDDFTKEKRKQFIAKIVMNDWDAVIVPHSVFDRISVALETVERFIEDEISGLEYGMDTLSWAKRKVIMRRVKSLKAKLANAIERQAKDVHISFEALGIDQLLIDEAHAYKNLSVTTQMGNVSGVQTGESAKATNAFLKMRNVNQRGGRVVLATGTPITNTLTETFIMMRYLQPELLEKAGVDNFDAWAATFGQVVNSVEVAPDGSGFRMASRFSRFHNLPELVTMVRQCWDMIDPSEVNLKLPTVRGGKAEVVTSEKSEALALYISQLVDRAKKVRDKLVEPNEDNFLKIVSDGRKAALDMRLVKPGSEDEAGSKVNMAARRIFEVWGESAHVRGTQLVFCDLSTPARGVFNVYDEIAGKLVGRGIPADQIAFIHDFDSDTAKDRLFKRVNAGQVRILFGSTEKMGIGTNVQKRIVAIHEIDGPWRPADVEQRVGRGVRVGNTNEEIALIRYVTEGSFDAYVWQGLERKSAFIRAFMSGNLSGRSSEDVDETTLSYNEIKAIASGNPQVRERVMLQSEVAKLNAVVRSEQSQRSGYEFDLKFMPTRMDAARRAVEKGTLDVPKVVDTSGDSFVATIQGQPIANRKLVGEAILLALNLAKNETRQTSRDSTMKVGAISGFDIEVLATKFGESVYLVGAMNYEVKVQADGVQQAIALTRALAEISTDLDNAVARTHFLMGRKAELEQQLATMPNSADKLAALTLKLEMLDRQLEIA